MKIALSLCLIAILFSCRQRPKENTVFYLNIGGEPSNLHPINGQSDAYGSAVREYIFESLLTRDIDTFEWKPALATSYTIADDKKSFTFKLREGIKFHGGEKFTAHDVVFSFKANFDDRFNGAAYRSYYEGIKDIEVIDDYSIKVTTKSEYYKNFDIVAQMTILSKKYFDRIEKKSFFNKNLNGTGPYIMTSYNRGNRILLEKNKDWWGFNESTPSREWKFNKIALRFVSDRTVSLEMLKKGSLDMISLSPDDYFKKAIGPVWGKSVHKVITENNTPKGFSFIGWNNLHPVLKDRNVRKALFKLVNRRLMIEKFERNMSVPATAPIYPGSPYLDKELPVIEFDPKESLSILRSIGWKDTDGDNILDKVIDGKKQKLSITILEPNEQFVKYLTVFKEDARKAGVEINIKLIEWNSFIKLLDEKKFDAIRLGWSASIDWDPVQIWHSKSIEGGSNFISYRNSEFDDLADKARNIHDRSERIKILKKAQRLIVNDYPYVWFSFKPKTMYGFTDRIKREKDTYNFGIGTSFWDFKSKIRKESY